MTDKLFIFNLPPIVLPKYQLSGILELLRDRVSKHYMPSSNGRITRNTKPEYTKHELPDRPGWPSVHRLEPSGYFCMQDMLGYSNTKPVFYNLHISHFQILINLQTEEALIRFCEVPDAVFLEWKDDPDQTIPLMPDHLKEIIDVYG